MYLGELVPRKETPKIYKNRDTREKVTFAVVAYSDGVSTYKIQNGTSEYFDWNTSIREAVRFITQYCECQNLVPNIRIN